MTTEPESKWKIMIEKGKPFFDALLADLEREATLIRERDLDPRNLADEPRVQEARSSAVEALEYLTEFARSMDGLVKTYAADLDKKVDVQAIKEQLAAAPAAGRAYLESADGQAMTEQIKVATEDARAKLEAESVKRKEQIEAAADTSKQSVEAAALKSKESVEAAASKGKVEASAVVEKGKDSTAEMLAALGWLAAAGAIIYMVFMDEKRRRQSKKVAKAAASGLLVVASSATKKS